MRKLANGVKLAILAGLVAGLFLAVDGIVDAAWTTPKTWDSINPPTAAEFNAHIRDNLTLLKTSINDDGTIDPQDTGYFKFARKTSDQTISSTTFANVGDLSFAIGASESWIVNVELMVLGNESSDWKVIFTVPASPTATWWGIHGSNPNNDNTQSQASPTGAISVQAHSATVREKLSINALIRNGSNAGTVQLQAGKLAASGDLTIYAESYLEARRVQ
jgi:hypothetical protein